VQSVVGSVFELPRAWKRKRGESTVDHFARWCGFALVHGRDQFAGQPFVFEGWQYDFLAEALAEDEGMPVWSSVALVVSKKNGKTAMLAAWSLYRLIFGVGQPEILLAAASDKQAGRLFEAVIGYIRRNPELVKLVHLREYIGEVSRVDGGAKILRMASDPSTMHGYDPSDTVVDELHGFTKPSLRSVWTALTTSGGARKTTRVFAISTAGDAMERSSSILGRLIDGNEQFGELERRPGLTISRNPDARTLVFNYSAPTSDPHNIAAMKLANPSSWITEEYLKRQAENPELSDGDVLRFHGCVWAVSESSWLDPAAWAARKAVRGLEEGEKLVLGFDGSYRRDATALVASTLDGHLVPLAVWERPERAPDDWKIPRAEVDAVLADAMERYKVVELAADPPGWHAEIDGWRETYGEIVVDFSTNQRQRMAAACDGFRAGVLEGDLTHNGDAALARHVGNCRAKETPSGTVVVKSGEERKIDAAVAAIVAYDRARWHAGQKEQPFPMVAWA
jgi:phage terminase large subunit-like protein